MYFNYFDNSLIFSLALYIFAYICYLKLSHGLGHKAEYLQLRRFIPCAVLAVLPVYLTSTPLEYPPYILSVFTGILWILTYPSLYFCTYRNSSSDFGFHLDTVFGLYIIGWLASLKLLVQYFNLMPSISFILISIIELVLILIPLAQLIYYFIYKTCITDSALALIRETDFNETIEFYNSLPKFIQIFTPLIIIFLCVAVFYINFNFIAIPQLPTINLALTLIAFLFMTTYLWKPKKGVFTRTGIIKLYIDVLHYLEETKQYSINLKKRLEELYVTPNKKPFSKPATIILIIGESASRDYMSAFSNSINDNTTPWLNQMKQDEHFITFPNAYACTDKTVPVLELALTEANQYNTKKFYESCSIIDIAKKSGYKTYWFSNQGYIGGAETAITLVANTADKAEWTQQNLNQYQHDETLLENLKQVNATENNFIVLHLMGSHFNFINRYPKNFSKFSKPGKYDLVPNYLDSLAYTDYVLQQVFEYGKKHLKLQAMVYFSDHATIPDKRRSPDFSGFANVRIPFFVYLADEYIKNNSDTYNNLRINQNKFFTNDLIYDFMCGVFDISSNHYDEKNSLTSIHYKYKLEHLTTNLGKIYIKDDNIK